MPNLDKTGPRGQGPLTGRGLGPCGSGLRKGAGRGYGMGFGRGMSRGFNFCGCHVYGFYPQVISEKEEKEMLKEEAKMLEEELKEIKARITEIK